MSNSVATENQSLASEVLSELSAVPVAFPVGTTPPVPTTATTSRRRPRVVRNAPVVVPTTEEINYDAPTEETPTEIPTPAPTPEIPMTSVPTAEYQKLMDELKTLRDFKKSADEKDKKKADQRKARRDARKSGGGEGGEGGGGRKSRAKKTGLSEEDVRRIAQEEARKINGASVADDSEDEENAEDADE